MNATPTNRRLYRRDHRNVRRMRRVDWRSASTPMFVNRIPCVTVFAVPPRRLPTRLNPHAVLAYIVGAVGSAVLVIGGSR